MSRLRPDAVQEVRESDYLDLDLGPPEDTDVYYRATPAPGQREHVAAPVASRATDDHGRMPRRRSRPERISRRSISSRQLAVPAAVAALLGACLLGTGLFVWTVASAVRSLPTVGAWDGGGEPTAVAELPDEGKTDAGRDAKWQGIQVKKGLR